jgi:hypothetical protein
MILSNPFPLKVRVLFMDCYACWVCGGNGNNAGGTEMHHIFGRVSGSACNCAVVCGRCHSHMGHGIEERLFLFKKTLVFLYEKFKQGLFKMGKDDFDFLEYIKNDIRGVDIGHLLG